MEGVSGKFFNLTNEEITAPHARNRDIGLQVFQKSIELTKLENENVYDI
jgi:hypothetical protein